MPRRTHPPVAAKHARAHTRQMRRRKQRQRWQRAKNERGLEYAVSAQPPWAYRDAKGVPVDLTTWDRDRERAYPQHRRWRANRRRYRGPYRKMVDIPADIAPLLDAYCRRTGQAPPRLLVHPDDVHRIAPALARFFGLRPRERGVLADRLLYDRYRFVYELDWEYPQRMPGYNASRRRLSRQLIDEQLSGGPADGQPGGRGQRKFERHARRLSRRKPARTPGA